MQVLIYLGGQSISQNYRVNDKIRADKVLVIDQEGQNLGVLDTAEAVRIALESGTDLVEVAPEASPPVCRILDYGKLKYQQKKKSNQKKKKSPQQKEIRIRPKIGEHDQMVKMKQVRQFLNEGNKVLVSMNFRGREMAHISMAKELMERWTEDLADVAKIEKLPKLEGRRMTMLFASK
jgi:translation initiation factor IF-3